MNQLSTYGTCLASTLKLPFSILSKLKEHGKKAVVKLKSFNEDSSRGYFDYNVISLDVEDLKYVNGT